MATKETLIRELREKTSAGILDCQKALNECNNDIEAATFYLRKKGLAKAAKKSDRAASEGRALALVSKDFKKGLIIEVNCETDFASRNDLFKAVVEKIAEKGLESNCDTIEALNAVKLNNEETVEEAIKSLIAKIGENIVLRRFYKSEGNCFNAYNHGNGKIAVLLEFKGDANEDNLALTKDITMHIAAMSPSVLKKEDFAPAVIEREIELYRDEFAKTGKPAPVIDMMVQGKLNNSFYKTNCLLEQEFIKDPKVTVAQCTKGKVELIGFKRFILGEQSN